MLKNNIRRYGSLHCASFTIYKSKGRTAPEERGSEGGRPRSGGAFRYCAMSKDQMRSVKGGEEDINDI